MNMTKEKAAAEIKRLRKQAQNEKLPQDARNEMLDRANAIEYEFYEKENGMAKGGAVKKKDYMYGGDAKKEMMAKGGAVKKKGYMYGGDAKKEMMAKGGAVKKKPAAAKDMGKRSPVVAVMIGMTDKKKMAKGGYANCGASVKASRSK